MCRKVVCYATLKMMLLMIATIVRSREEILGLVVVIAVSIGFFGIKADFSPFRQGARFVFGGRLPVSSKTTTSLRLH
jgi:ABC-type Na+ efflux pump permease subunit